MQETLRLLSDKRSLNALLEGHSRRETGQRIDSPSIELFHDLQDSNSWECAGRLDLVAQKWQESTGLYDLWSITRNRHFLFQRTLWLTNDYRRPRRELGQEKPDPLRATGAALPLWQPKRKPKSTAARHFVRNCCILSPPVPKYPAKKNFGHWRTLQWKPALLKTLSDELFFTLLVLYLCQLGSKPSSPAKIL